MLPVARRLTATWALAFVLTAGCTGSPSAAPAATPAETASPTPSAVTDLTIVEPAEGALVTTDTVVVRGTGPEGATITQDIRLGEDFHANVSGGRWSLPVKLRPGINEL